MQLREATNTMTSLLSKIVLLGLCISPSWAFLTPAVRQQHRFTTLFSSSDSSTNTAVRAPLKYIGPYPCLALRFPELATSSQRARNVKGVSLDFVLDTAANTNTINEQVAKELALEVVGSALPGVGAAGTISGGETYLLGDAQLEGLSDGEEFTFMTDLTASALPVASPAAAGLLSLAFLQCFEGGVEFSWGTSPDDVATPPAVTFYGATVDSILEGRTRVRIQRVPVTQLPSVTVEINGVGMPALLDTGSPVTVLNHQAAQRAGIETVALPKKNPIAAFTNRLKGQDDVLTIMGVTGTPVDLLKSKQTCQVSMSSGDVSFGEGHVYVGDLPGLAALNGLGVDSPPAVVLGMDVLRRRPSMLLRARNNEVWF